MNPDETEGSPVAQETSSWHRRLLGQQLRSLRTAAGLSAQAVAEHMQTSSASWITRIEKGQRGIQLRDVTRLLDLYQVGDEATREDLLEMARQVRQRGWWQPYKTVLPERYVDYIGLEAAASRIRNAELDVVPGLLQTEAYMRELLSHSMDVFSAEEVESRVKARLGRQSSVLNSQTQVEILLDESVLHRVVGGPVLMCEQLAHLARAGGEAGLTLRLLPFERGTHAGFSGSVVLLDFATMAPPVACIEHVAGTMFLEGATDLEACNETWAYMGEWALSETDTLERLVEAAEAFEKKADQA